MVVIIIIWGAFIHPMGATLIQYAHTLMSKTPTITHSEQLARQQLLRCSMGILTHGTATAGSVTTT